MTTTNTTEKIDWCKKRLKGCNEYMYSTGYYNNGEFREDECKVINYLLNEKNNLEGEFISVIKKR
jgi:hypothetical protein